MKRPYYKPVKMLVTITIPIETEVRELKEVPIIAESIVYNMKEDEAIEKLASCMRYYQTTEDHRVVFDGDACDLEDVECFIDWDKVKTKVDLVKKTA